ncbi:hybrid sensor histidine kinase/response regulator [Caballeronia sp. LZ008]|uniref:hybrid sensor histidine kinase/response regulator n=1 Tax=unclassified Caballeronia TaxID=2646786 RepID=UPI0020292D20|nr:MULTISPECIES: hybrid sensor histidine kinase/response regulator [unclassified Caballeronia]MDR5798223.1 hybrid sensor histidine kinase/response regulator [Caballeronia sp. LZ008]
MQLFSRLRHRPVTGMTAPSFSWWTIFTPPARFDASLERQYLSYYGPHYVAYRQAAVVLSLVTWVLFIGWDAIYAYTDGSYAQIAPGVVLLRALGLIVILDFVRKTRRGSFANEVEATRLIVSHTFAVYVLKLTVFYIVPTAYFVIYFFCGPCLILIFIYGLSRLLSRPTIHLSILCGSVTLIAMYLRREDPAFDNTVFPFAPYYFWISASYLGTIILVGIAVVTELERTSRASFLRQKKLDASKADEQEKNLKLRQLNQELRDAQMDLENKTAALVKSMDERRRLAEEVNKEKSFFISCAIHDVRQPATAMLTLLHPIKKALDDKQFDVLAAHLKRLMYAGEIMNASFNNVLDFSRMESGLVTPSYCSVNPNRILQTVADSMRISAENSAVWIKVKPSRHDDLMVRTDHSFLHRILCNLISNSIKYRDAFKSPKIVISVVRLRHSARIDVMDNGVGISERHWEEIFKPFFQISNSLNDNDKGIGLGLSLINAMISRLDEHRIEFRSVEGRGTRFSVHVPIIKASSEVLLETNRRSYVPRRLRHLHVVVVERDTLVRECITDCLSSFGAIARAVASFAELNDMMRKAEMAPDILLLAVIVGDPEPDMREVERTSASFDVKIPIIYILDGAGHPSWLCSSALTISKPFLPEDLVHKMMCAIPHYDETRVWE